MSCKASKLLRILVIVDCPIRLVINLKASPCEQRIIAKDVIVSARHLHYVIKKGHFNHMVILKKQN